MITRVPQGNFIGSAPADIVAQNASTAQRYAEMIQQGMQEGARQFQTSMQMQQQAKLQKQAETSASDQLRMKLLADDLSSKMSAAGPGEEANIFLDNENQFKTLFKFYAGGNDDLANSMFEGTAKQFLGSMSADSMLKRGILSIDQTGGQAQQPAAANVPQAPSQPSQVPSIPSQEPVAPVGAQPQPQAQAQPSASDIQLAHPLPEKPEEVASVASTLANNADLKIGRAHV
jgi:hypothetical protein